MLNTHSRTAGLLCTALLVASITHTARADLDEVVVTAKTRQSLADVLVTSTIFNQSDIIAAQATDLPDLLDQITGVSVNDSGGRGSTTSVFLRGASSAQTIVLIDGVRVGSATLGAAALNSYPIEAIDRIEVVKGPLSGIYGADAVGGVIHLFTKKGGDGRGVVTATIGSDSLQEYGISFNGGNQRHSFHISAQSEQTDGFDRTSIVSGGNEDRDGFEETAFSLGGKITLSESTIANLSLLYSDNTADIDNTFGADDGLVNDTTTLSSAINLASRLTETVRWETTFGSNKDEFSSNGDFPSQFTTRRDNFGSELSIALAENSQLIVGADYYQEEIASSNTFPVTDRDNSGVFALLQSSAGAFGVVASLRYDDNSAYGTETNGSLAANYDFNDNLRLVMSYGTAFVAPSFNFLYFPFFGNPDLEPEESKSFEVSLLGTSSAIDWRVSAYQTEVKNLFSFDPATFLAANVGMAELEGLEIELQSRLADWNIGINLDLLSATDKDTGIQLNDRAEQSLAVIAARKFGPLELRFDLKGESHRYDNNGTELSAYGLLDVKAHYKINDNIAILANIDNLLDKDYIVNLIGADNHYNTRGRQGKLTVRYQF